MKKIVFLTGTRADFGKLKALLNAANSHHSFDVHIFATGMHMSPRHGMTVNEIVKQGYPNIYKHEVEGAEDEMDRTVARTILGLSNFICDIEPDLVVVHGDRGEALAGAIVGALNNILVAHIEGGELSGTIDGMVRHAITKISHVHFVANLQAQSRLVQMGENIESIYVIGSPEVDIIKSDTLPGLTKVRNRYEIPFSKYGILVLHPVTTEFDLMHEYAETVVSAVLKSTRKYVVIKPNNDLGSGIILDAYKRFEHNKKIKIIPSMRFEYFLSLMNHAQFVIGNSSAGIREAPIFGVPTINIGTRQTNRANISGIKNTGYDEGEILDAIAWTGKFAPVPVNNFGEGGAAEAFMAALNHQEFWQTPKQKMFADI